MNPGTPKPPSIGVAALGYLRYLGEFYGWRIWEDTGDTGEARFLVQSNLPGYDVGAWDTKRLPPEVLNLLSLL